MRIDSTTNIGINNTAIPGEALDVTGKIKVSDPITIDGTTPALTLVQVLLIVKGGVGVAGDINVGGNINITGATQVRDITPDVTNTRPNRYRQ